MKIAVVILNWNGRSLLEQFLPSVTRHSGEATVYVADNASVDDSIGFLRREYPEVKIIQNEVNGGYAKGYNDALQHLSEDIFILLNSDVEVTPGWLGPIIGEFSKNPSTGALQPKILDYRKRDQFEYAGAAGGFIDLFGYPYCRGRIFDHLEKDRGQYDANASVFWASGACLAIRREAYYSAGQLDEDYFAHQEEIDLCWRLFNSGWEVRSVGTSAVYHLGGATLDNMHPKKAFYNFRNSLYSLLKNVPGKKVVLVIFARLLLDGVAGIKFLAAFRFRHTLAIIQAHFSFYANLFRFLEKRKKIPKRTKYFHKPCVLWSYHFFKKKKFSEL